MFDGLKTSVAVLIGLLLGVAVAVPLAWHGSRLGADSLRHNIDRDLASVEQRQQAMADQALSLEELLVKKGYHKDDQVLRAGDGPARSRLAGVAPLEQKLEAVQALEQALLLSEKSLGTRRRGQSRSLELLLGRARPHVGEAEAEPGQRAGVAGEFRGGAEPAAGHMAGLDPAGLQDLLGPAWSGTSFGDVFGNLSYGARWSLDWLGYAARRLASLRSQEKPPEPPKWERPKGRQGHRLSGSDGDAALPGGRSDGPRTNTASCSTPKRATITPTWIWARTKPCSRIAGAPEGYKVVVPKPQATVVYK